MICNREVDLCPVGAVAFLLFVHFHVLRKPVPSFVPDFEDERYGMYGRRDWYDYYLFQPDADHMDEAMKYDGELYLTIFFS